MKALPILDLNNTNTYKSTNVLSHIHKTPISDCKFKFERIACMFDFKL